MSTIEIPQPKEFDVKMPNGYDFSTKGTNWKAYKPFYLLRTDAVWEKSKLYQYFYSMYKNPIYFNNDKFYLISDTYMYYYIVHRSKGDFSYDQIGESGENHKIAKQYSHNGEIFEFDFDGKKNTPNRTTSYVGDFSKECTTLCMLKFFKWMRCNQKSEYKLTTINNNEENMVMKYDCFKELSELKDHCINYHFKVMMELFYFRVLHDEKKWNSAQGLIRTHHESRRPGNSRVLYY